MKGPWAGTLLVALLALAGCGGGEESDSGADAFERVEQQEAERSEESGVVAAPRWEPVKTLSGDGDASALVEISDEAIQWRASWTCEGADFALAAGMEQLEEGPCRGEGEETSVDTGAVDLEVRSDGRWRLAVEQQVDTPLNEPPLPPIASGAAEQVAAGDFYRIENRGEGSARLYRLPGGRLALRMERFRTAANIDLFVWLSTAARPTTTKEALRAPHVEIALLKSTLGDQNYLLPDGFDPARAASVVIWCEPIRVAYTAATLTP